jgi:hypothetical protein
MNPLLLKTNLLGHYLTIRIKNYSKTSLSAKNPL